MQQINIFANENQNGLSNLSKGVANQLTTPLNMQNIQNRDSNRKNQSESKFFHFLFVFFDEITKLHIRSFFFYFFQAIIAFIQLISVSWYGYLPNVWNKDKSTFAKIIVGINSIVMLDSTNDPNDPPLPAMIIPFAWNLLIAIILVITYFSFKNSGTIAKNLSIFISIVLEILFFIGFLPSFASLGTVLRFVPDKEPLVVLFFVIYLFVITFDIIILLTLTHLVNYCTNPTISFLTTFNGHHISNLLLFSGIIIVFTNMATVFDDWFYIVAIVVHILFMAYQIFDLFEFPLVRLWTQPVFGGYYAASIITDILTIVTIFNSSLSDTIKFVVPIGAFIVGWAAFYFIFRFEIKKVNDLLDPKDIPDEEKIRYFEDLPCKSVRQATRFLHIGLSKLRPAVLDGSFGLIVSQRFNNYNLWLLTASITAFIPCNQAQLDQCIEKLSKMYSKSIVNRILIKRLVKIQKNRALVSSGDIEDKISAMKLRTDDCINTIKQFWNQISTEGERVKDSSIGVIAASINSTKRSWNEMLSMYPNESQLAVGYSNFLIECLGKFEDGIVWKVKGGHLEKGFHADLDKFFQAFVVSMPKLWKEKMVDRFGNLSKGATVDLSHTTTSTVTAQEKLEEDMEGGILDQCAEEMLLWPRLRMSLTKATSHYRPKGLAFFQLLKYLAFIVWIVLMIVTLVFYSSLFNRIDTNYNRINYLKDVQVGLNNMRTLFIFKITKTFFPQLFFTDDNYTKYLPPEALEETDLEFGYNDFDHWFLIWSFMSLDSMNDLYHTFSDSAMNGEDITQILSTFLNTSAITRYIGGQTATTSPKNAMIALLYNYDKLMVKFKPTDVKSTLTGFLLAYGMHHSFSSNTNNFISDVVDQARSEGERIQKNSKTYVIIDLVIVIVVCLPLSYIPIILIAADERKVFKALKSVKPEGAKKASETLVKDSDQKIDYLASQNIQTTTNSIICLAVVYTLLFVISIIFISVAYVTIKSKAPYIADLIELLGYGCLRHSYIQEDFSLVSMLKFLSIIDGMYDMGGMVNPAELLTSMTNSINKYHSYFMNGRDGKKGIKDISSKINELHTKDSCNPPLSTELQHPLYQCISLDRLISSFITSANSFVQATTVFYNDSSFINLFHMSTAELSRKLSQSDDLMTKLVSDTANQAEVVAVILIVIALIVVLINILISVVFEQTLMKNLKASLILIRHLPPPVVVETPKIVDILLVKKTEESEDFDDPKQIVFNTTDQPIICIGDGFIIEAINKAFKKSFNFSGEQLVGKKLTSLIDEPVELEGEKTPQEQGAFRMYEKMNLMLEQDDSHKCNYPVVCICGDEEEVNTVVDVFPVYDKSEHISNFIIFIEDRKKTGKIREHLEEMKNESMMLSTQLLPKEVSNFFSGKEEDYAFSAKTSTVVSVQIVQAAEMVNNSGSKLSRLFGQIDQIAKDHDSFIKVQTLYDTVIFAGGLFSQEGDNAHCKEGIEFAKEIKRELNGQLPENEKGGARFEISVTSGGPLICSVNNDKHKSFEVFGNLIDNAIQLQSAAPPDSIIISESTKALLSVKENEGNNENKAAAPQPAAAPPANTEPEPNIFDEMKPGITVLDQNTYVL